jgi:hypothetical protein
VRESAVRETAAGRVLGMFAEALRGGCATGAAFTL